MQDEVIVEKCDKYLAKLSYEEQIKIYITAVELAKKCKAKSPRECRYELLLKLLECNENCKCAIK